MNTEWRCHGPARTQVSSLKQYTKDLMKLDIWSDQSNYSKPKIKVAWRLSTQLHRRLEQHVGLHLHLPLIFYDFNENFNVVMLHLFLPREVNFKIQCNINQLINIILWYINLEVSLYVIFCILLNSFISLASYSRDRGFKFQHRDRLC
jgi:hypothetical protein